MPDYAFRVASFINHTIHAKTRYYIHSPFVYALVAETLRKPISASIHETLIALRKKQFSDWRKVEIRPVGTSREQTIATFAFAELARRYSLPWRHGLLLVKLVERFRPHTILETGTGTGFSAACMALGNPNAVVHTIDAQRPLIDAASEILKNHRIDNVVFHHGMIDDMLADVCRNLKTIDAAFLDANHTHAATLRYFNTVLPHLTTKAVVIVDDIHWSKDMNRAWNDLCNHPRVTTSLDFYRFGVLFVDPELSRQSFRLYS